MDLRDSITDEEKRTAISIRRYPSPLIDPESYSHCELEYKDYTILVTKTCKAYYIHTDSFNWARHRLNGPAITHHDGTQAWYIYGMRWDI